MVKERNSRLDGVKLLLIVLVVIGHCIEPSSYSNSVSGSLYSVIYSFHMPLFVFISGYFAKVGSFNEWKSKGLRFFETFLIIMIPQFLFFRNWHIFLNPENSGWYLMSLAWWYGIVLIVSKLKLESSGWGGVIVSILVSVVVFLLPLGDYGRLLSFNRTIQMFPFFYGGYLCKKHGLYLPKEIGKKSNIILLMLTIVSISLLLLFTCRTLHVLEFYNVDAWSISSNSGYSVWLILGCRLLLMVCAIVISVVIIENLQLPEKISVLGSSTLVIYVIQGIGAHLLPVIAPNNLYVELGLAAVIFILSVLLIKTIDCRYITNPVSTICERFKNKNNEVIK